ncbi:hypothetical protein VTJ49DRAFT_4151 [Mycothermus thermophilus]|uniref:5'-3' DNA helicase ZGRF1-like N-terminal domain-containing protein n=1 Tax=Humicola insolens TaxID=85995 RepID=A0ABR3VMI6_HUMIN
MPPVIGRSPASTAGSSSATTAPIHEFTCLFTHDLRRKQKRWEDGRLRYHTFNKRVMVYDERGHFIGDTHWHHDWDFGEGEEFQLDRGAVIVQVNECVGRQDQDLSELLDRRTKEKEQRQSRTAARPVPSSGVSITPLLGARANDNFQTRHRPLNQLLTPTGHHGRAVVPSESPFDLRQRAADGDRTNEPPPKRRKREDTKPAFAQHLFGATLTLSATPLSSAPPPKSVVSTYRRQQTSSPPDAGYPSEEEPQVSGEDNSAVGSSVAGSVPGPSKIPDRPDRVSVGDRRPAESVSSVPAIVLDEDRDDENLDPQDLPFGRQGVTKATPLDSKPAQESKQKPKRDRPVEPFAPPRSRDQQVSPQPEEVEEPPPEERRELRLKPRPKRGLLCLTEGKTKAKQTKRRPATTEPKTGGRSLDRVMEEEVPERTVETSGHSEDISSVAAEDVFEPPQASPNQTEETGRKPTSPPSPRATFDEEDIERHMVDMPEVPGAPSPGTAFDDEDIERHMMEMSEMPGSPKPVPDGINDAPLDNEDIECHMADVADSPKPKSDGASDARDVFDLSSSPPARRGRSKRRVPAKAFADPSESSSSGPEPSPEEAAEEPALPSSPPKAQAKRNLRDRRPARKKARKADSSSEPESSEESAEEPELPESPPKAQPKRSVREQRPARKKARKAHSDESDEDVPPPPVRPKLTRLSKSVRSREVIGFIPSSPPAVNYNSLLRVPVGAGASGFAQDVEPYPQPSDAVPEERNEDQLPDKDGPVPPQTNVAPRGSSTADGQKHDSANEEPTAQLTVVAPRRSKPPHRDRLARRQTADGDDDRTDGPTETDQGRQSVVTEATTTPSTMSTGSFAQERASGTRTKQPPSSSHDSINLQKQPARPINETGNSASDVCVTKRPDNSPKAPPQSASPPPVAAPISDTLPPAPATRTTPASAATTTTTGINTATNTDPTAAPTLQVKTEETEPAPPAPAAAAAPARPRIANPATRGRKAALKSDAIGLVPIPVLPVLPPDPTGPASRMGMGLGMGGGGGGGGLAPPPPAREERPKRVMRFPGFASARDGGPWSREAHDLLEKARPV